MNEVQNTGTPLDIHPEELANADAVKYTRERDKNDPDYQRFTRMLHVIFNMCSLTGFRLENRLVVRDLKTGKIYK